MRYPSQPGLTLRVQVREVLAATAGRDLREPGERPGLVPPAGHPLGVAHSHAGPRHLQPGLSGHPGQAGGPPSDHRTGEDSSQVSGRVWQDNPDNDLLQANN